MDISCNTLYQSLLTRLAPRYSGGEAQAITLLLLEEGFGVERVDVYASKVKNFSADELHRWENMCERLAEGEPVQYVLGTAHFCSHSYHVTPATLIPRPETEELVTLALKAIGNREVARPVRVLDVGTGSGCIAVELALALGEKADVEAWDISPDALRVAQTNARQLGVVVKFKRVDVLEAATEQTLNAAYDIIVSNPPYVCEWERGAMEENVLAYEPATALFVPDNDPLRFYKALARLAQSCLAIGGWLAVEVNQAFAEETAQLFSSYAFSAVSVHADCFAAPRFVTAIRSVSR